MDALFAMAPSNGRLRSVGFAPDQIGTACCPLIMPLLLRPATRTSDWRKSIDAVRIERDVLSRKKSSQ